MFKNKKSPIDVVIALDISPSQAESIYMDFLRLDQRNIITQTFDKVKDHVDDFLQYCNIMNKGGDDPMKLRIF